MGGKVFEHTSSILKEQILPTVNWLEASLDFPKNYMSEHLLGSALNKPISGDIDLNINEEIFDFDKIENNLKTLLGSDNILSRKANHQIFTKVPIFDTKQFVQIDFMFGNEKWQEFSYRGSDTPNEKGLFRTELIKAWVAFCSDFTQIENNELVARVGPTFFHHNGCVWRYRARPFKIKQPNKRTKEFKEFTEEEFFELFPQATKSTRKIINTPEDLFKLLTNHDYVLQYKEWHTSFANLKNLIQKFVSKSNIDIIQKIYDERLDSLKITRSKDHYNVRAS